MLVGSTSVVFSGIENLTGGTANDSFEIAATGLLPGALNGGNGTGLNTLSYQSWTTDVVVNLASSSAGNATAISGVTSNISMLIGGSGNDR